MTLGCVLCVNELFCSLIVFVAQRINFWNMLLHIRIISSVREYKSSCIYIHKKIKGNKKVLRKQKSDSIA